jgi:hypothetical protein
MARCVKVAELALGKPISLAALTMQSSNALTSAGDIPAIIGEALISMTTRAATAARNHGVMGNITIAC